MFIDDLVYKEKGKRCCFPFSLYTNLSFQIRSKEPVLSECGCLPEFDGFLIKRQGYEVMPMLIRSRYGKVQSSFRQCGNGTSNGWPDMYRN